MVLAAVIVKETIMSVTKKSSLLTILIISVLMGVGYVIIQFPWTVIIAGSIFLFMCLWVLIYVKCEEYFLTKKE